MRYFLLEWAFFSAFRRSRAQALPSAANAVRPRNHKAFCAGIALAITVYGTADLHAEAPPRTPALLATATASPDTASPDKASPTQPVKSFASQAPAEAETIAGFRMEGAPLLETVFGDIASYKARIDHFSTLHTTMGAERKRFATAAHFLQGTLGSMKRVPRKRSACPSDSLAASVFVAHQSHEQFKKLGVQFERSFLVIRDLHDLGESAGLTPDYRARVRNSRGEYQEALNDLAEMNAVLQLQLAPELAKRGCKTAELMQYAKDQQELEKTRTERATLEAAAAAETKASVEAKTNSESTTVRARAVTFFVDNRECDDDVNIYVDGKRLGHVAGKTHAAFQSLSGRHALCLLTDGDLAECGDTGTVRTAFVHDGFRIQRSCNEAN